LNIASDASWPRSIGVIGLGIMGSAVARRLAAAGREVIGFDIDPSRAQEIAEPRFRKAASSASAAEEADLLLTSLPAEDSLAAVVDAILGARRRSDQALVELSTLSLACKRRELERLASAGVAMLDTPVSGTGAQAAAGDLVLYVSGDEAVSRRCLPVFADFSRKAIYLGAFGAGTKMKFVANLLVAVHNVAAAEAVSLGLRYGLDAVSLCEVLSAGAGQSRMLEIRGPMMVQGVYEPPTMKLDVWQKDMRLIEAFAHEAGVATPLFDATIPLYRAAVAQGHGQKDTAAVRLALEASAK
jgi:3-hydroxyisobutyrate dehydrogenase-like beta-hydroxyacid dehydrogenase